MVERLHAQNIVPKAVLYARFSSDNQRSESIDAQVRAIREFAEKNAIVIVSEYIDMAKSATSDDREQFQKMIKDASKGNFQFVIVHKLDRFARNRRDSVGYRVELARKGVQLVSVLESFDEDTPEGALMQGLSELLAEFYSKNLSREVKKGQKENALKAKHNGGTPPFGYDVDPITKKLVINEHEATGVKLMFRMVMERFSYEDILKELHSCGFKTKRGRDFGRNSVHDILRNEKYTGKYFYRRIASPLLGVKKKNSHKFNAPEDMIIVDGGVPIIIEKNQFETVQQLLDTRKQRGIRKRETYLLAGKIVCGKCGMAYCGNRAFNRQRNYVSVTYRCDGSRKLKENRCNNGVVNRDMLDKKVLECLSELVFDPSVIPELMVKAEQSLRENNKKKAGVIANIRRQEIDIDKKIRNILIAVESGKGANLLLERLDKLEAEKKQLATQLAKEEAKGNTQQIDKSKLVLLFSKAKEMLKSGALDGTRRLIDMFIDKIIVNEDTISIRYNPTSFILGGDGIVFEKIFSRNDVRIYKKHKH